MYLFQADNGRVRFNTFSAQAYRTTSITRRMQTKPKSLFQKAVKRQIQALY